MIVYLDLIFFMNFFYDLLLLMTVSVVLKRNRKVVYHIISAVFGASSSDPSRRGRGFRRRSCGQMRPGGLALHDPAKRLLSAP